MNKKIIITVLSIALIVSTGIILKMNSVITDYETETLYLETSITNLKNRINPNDYEEFLKSYDIAKKKHSEVATKMLGVYRLELNNLNWLKDYNNQTRSEYVHSAINVMLLDRITQNEYKNEVVFITEYEKYSILNSCKLLGSIQEQNEFILNYLIKEYDYAVANQGTFKQDYEGRILE